MNPHHDDDSHVENQMSNEEKGIPKERVTSAFMRGSSILQFLLSGLFYNTISMLKRERDRHSEMGVTETTKFLNDRLDDQTRDSDTLGHIICSSHSDCKWSVSSACEREALNSRLNDCQSLKMKNNFAAHVLVKTLRKWRRYNCISRRIRLHSACMRSDSDIIKRERKHERCCQDSKR